MLPLLLNIPLNILDKMLSCSDVALRSVRAGVPCIACPEVLLQLGHLLLPGEGPDVSEVPLPRWEWARAGEPGGGRNPVVGQSWGGEVGLSGELTVLGLAEISLAWGRQSRLESGVSHWSHWISSTGILQQLKITINHTATVLRSCR